MNWVASTWKITDQIHNAQQLMNKVEVAQSKKTIAYSRHLCQLKNELDQAHLADSRCDSLELNGSHPFCWRIEERRQQKDNW